MPAVSILMTAYNSEAHLVPTLRSVVEQSYSDFELVVIDDASNDRTPQILQEWATKDHRIRVFRNEKNLGLSLSLNRGLDLVRGEFITRLDSDDISVLERLQRQVDFLRRNPEVGICGSNVISMDENGVPFTGPWFTKSSVPIEWRLIWESTYAASSVTFRAEIFHKTGYRYQNVPAEDSDLVRRLALHTRAVRLDEVLLHYRVRRDSLFHAFPEKHYRQALLSSTDLVQAITRRLPPVFHPWLTRHWRDLSEPTGSVALLDVAHWLRELLDRSALHWNWTEAESEAARKDAQERLSVFAFELVPVVRYKDYSTALSTLGGSPRGRLGLAFGRLSGRVFSERRRSMAKRGLHLLFTDPSRLVERVKRVFLDS